MANSSSVDPMSLDIKDNRTGERYVVPIFRNTVRAVDLKQIVAVSSSRNSTDLHAEGLRVVDEGFRNTAPVFSKISHLDPDKGTLQYRQYPITDLIVGGYGFEDCTHLLAKGTLPRAEERNKLRQELYSAMAIPATVFDVVRSFPRKAPTMMIIIAGLSAWTSSDPSAVPVIRGEDIYGTSPSLDKHISRTLAALGSVVSIVYCHQNDVPFTSPHPQYSYVENLLSMMGLVGGDSMRPHPEQTAQLEKLLLLHAEHGMCNATAAFLHCASTRADPISCLVAALVAIYGPLHGGSNIITFRQLQKIGKVENIPRLMQDVIARKQRLFGFGHRIYRAVDPRATILRDNMLEAKKQGADIPYLDVALELDKIVSTNSFFTSRNLKANTDLYTVIAYGAINIPEELVFPFICVSRAQGFMAHWREFMSENPPTWRPQQVYTGPESVAQGSKL